MGKSSKKKLEAKLTEADAGLRDLESTRASLTEELRSERERHAEQTTMLRREHEQLVDEVKRSTQEELTRVGEQLAEARAALEKATEETSRLAADLRDRDEHSRTLLQDLDDVVEATLGQLSGALTRIRDAAQAPASAPIPEDEGVPEAALVSTHEDAQGSDADDATPVAEEGPEPHAPIEDAEPADPPAGEDDEAASYEDDWYRFLKHTQGPAAT
jgi:hypothetical protein